MIMNELGGEYCKGLKDEICAHLSKEFKSNTTNISIQSIIFNTFSRTSDNLVMQNLSRLSDI